MAAIAKPYRSLSRQILDLLEDGPSTTEEVSTALGIPVRQACALLCSLRMRQFVSSTPFIKTPEPARRGPRNVRLWTLTGETQ